MPRKKLKRTEVQRVEEIDDQARENAQAPKRRRRRRRRARARGARLRGIAVGRKRKARAKRSQFKPLALLVERRDRLEQLIAERMTAAGEK